MTRVMAQFSRNRRPLGIAFVLGLVVASAVAVVRVKAAAELKGPQAKDKAVALSVTKTLLEEHLTRHPLDTEISRRCFKEFMKTLDSYKLYFWQSDFDTFKQSQDELASKISHGDIGFSYQVFETLLTRIDERMKLVDNILANADKLDFSTDEEMVTDPDLTTYASTPEQMQDKWTKRIKYDLLQQEVEKTPKAEVRDKLSRRYHGFAKRMHQINSDELLEMYLNALTTSFDPHTSYMSGSTLENFEIMMKAELDGIGASLQYDDGNTIVNELVDGGAAQLDGHLKPKDRVIGVGQGENGDIVDVVDMSLNDVVKLIRGKAGTVVRLKVIPVGKAEPKVYNITRAKIELKNSEARGEILEAGKKENGQAYKIGFIDLPGFYMDMDGARKGVPDFKSCTRDVRRILDGFNEKQVDAVIIDLRRDGGGALNEAISLTGLFIDTGPVVQVKDSKGQVQHYDDQDPGVAWKGPLVVLQSKFSASASEIFAGAIQDYRRGLVIGDHSSHGKGTVQSMLDVGQSLFFMPNSPSLGALKITIQQFYRPDGDSTQMRGVLSDVELPSLSTHLPVGEGDLDYALKFDHVDPVPYTPVGMVDPDLVKQLATLSADRVKRSSDFAKVDQNIARYLKQKDRKRVSLNREKFLADQADRDVDKEEEKEFDDSNAKRPVVKRDFYVNEVLAITDDYIRLSHVKVLATN
ncbi:MAG TPA: carboxy terminal-processing peptidase [Pirellulales bacterium]|nr:carboxy terminal-processing peptidase [Pirellulales bacterium]